MFEEQEFNEFSVVYKLIYYAFLMEKLPEALILWSRGLRLYSFLLLVLEFYLVYGICAYIEFRGIWLVIL